jgi:hypothetical protein
MRNAARARQSRDNTLRERRYFIKKYEKHLVPNPGAFRIHIFK